MKKKKASAHTCSILKKRISAAKTTKARGTALGAAMKAKCFRRHRHKKH